MAKSKRLMPQMPQAELDQYTRVKELRDRDLAPGMQPEAPPVVTGPPSYGTYEQQTTTAPLKRTPESYGIGEVPPPMTPPDPGMRMGTPDPTQADLLEQQAMQPQRPQPTKLWQQLLQGASEGVIETNRPGAMHERDVMDRQRQQDLLARAKDLRAAETQKTTAGMQQFNAQADRALEQQRFETTNRRLEEGQAATAAHQQVLEDIQRNQVQFAPAGSAIVQNGEVTGQVPARETNAGHITIANPKTGKREIWTTDARGMPVSKAGMAPEPGTDKLSPYGESNILSRLTTQWDKATRDVQDLYRANTIMQAGLQAARKGDLNSGSQAVLVTFQKFLDPESVVRESEYARSAEGLAMAARVQGYIERLRFGGAQVPLAELEAFATLAQTINNNLAREGNSLMAKQAERIRRNAQHFGIPEDLIFSGYDFTQSPTTPNTKAPGAPPPSASGWKVEVEK